MSDLSPASVTRKMSSDDVAKEAARSNAGDIKKAVSKAEVYESVVAEADEAAPKERLETFKSWFFSGLSFIPALLIIAFLVVVSII